MDADIVAYEQDGHVIERDDGFKLFHCSASGWDIVSPRGHLFAWAESLEEAELKIKAEKVERLWS